MSQRRHWGTWSREQAAIRDYYDRGLSLKATAKRRKLTEWRVWRLVKSVNPLTLKPKEAA